MVMYKYIYMYSSLRDDAHNNHIVIPIHTYLLAAYSFSRCTFCCYYFFCFLFVIYTVFVARIMKKPITYPRGNPSISNVRTTGRCCNVSPARTLCTVLSRCRVQSTTIKYGLSCLRGILLHVAYTWVRVGVQLANDSRRELPGSPRGVTDDRRRVVSLVFKTVSNGPPGTSRRPLLEVSSSRVLRRLNGRFQRLSGKHRPRLVRGFHKAHHVSFAPFECNQLFDVWFKRGFIFFF